MNKIYISWDEVGQMIDKLASKVKNSKFVFDGVYGIPRGGLTIAVSLSHRLNIPLLLQPTKNSLIVDDISDNGTTLDKYKDNKIATLHTTDWTKTMPEWNVEKKNDKNDWIVYPWEK